MKNVIRPATTLVLVTVVLMGAPSIPVASASPARPDYVPASAARPDYFNLCANPLFKWLCPR
ncbi:MAG: hypothetical protein ACOH1Y_11255 [Propionicimonas sp.]